MKANIRGRELVCPICQHNDFYVNEDVKIQAVKRDYNDDKLYVITKDEIECNECGWTGYFTNDWDVKQDWNEKRIKYST